MLTKYFSNNKNETVRTLLISEGFGFCFSLSWVWGYELDHFGTIFPGTGVALLGVMVALLLTQVLIAVGIFLKEKLFFFRLTRKSGLSRNRCWIIATAILILCWLPIYLAYFPSVFSYDAEAQISQVISKSYSTHHPLLHTLIMGTCLDLMYPIGGINAGMALYSGLQLIVMSVVLGWSVAELNKYAGVRLYMLFLCLFPVHGILAVSTTKDVIFSATLIIFVLLVRRFCTDCYENKIRLCVKIGLAAVLMLLFRNNAQYALLLLILWLVIFGIDYKKGIGRTRPWALVITMAGAMVIATLIGTGLKIGLHAESGSPREALSIPIQQMARVKALYGDELDETLSNDLNQLIDDEAGLKYDAHLADPVKERISMKQPGLFVKTWVKLGIKYPGTYIDAWLLTTEGAWYIRDTSCNRIYGEGSVTGFGYLSTDIRSMPEGFQVTNESKLPGLRSVLEKLVSDNCFEKIPVVRLIFSPALYFWIMMAYLYVCCIRRNRRLFIPACFLIGIYLTIMMGPAVLVRYMYPFMLAIILPMMGMGTEKNDNI